MINVICDVLGGWSRDLNTTMRKMLRPRGRVTSSTLNGIARTFKASSHKIVKQSQTVADDRRRIGKVELGSTFPIDTDCRRQSAITTSLCEHDRQLFADFI